MIEPLIVTVAEAARLLSISRSKAYELVASRALPSVKVGHSTRIPVDALRRWIDEQLAGQGSQGS